MNTYVALLRGINVGGKNVIPMADLKAIFGQAGATDVQTYIQSGNVVFCASDSKPGELAGRVSSYIERERGFAPAILAMSAKAFSDTVERCPFSSPNGKAIHIFFLAETPANPDLNRLEELRSETEEFLFDETVFFLHAPDGVGRSKLAARVENCLGVAVTARNLNTVQKLMGLLRE
jgi:uncharacterized protein (DUF1697 family)